MAGNSGFKLGIALDVHGRLLNPSARKDNYFEACMSKLDFMLGMCDAFIQAGDMFDKSREEDACKNRILSIFNKHQIPVYCAIGNHDVENDDPSTLSKTSLGNLAAHKSVTILDPNKIETIAGLKVGTLAYDVKEAKKQVFDEQPDIVIGHHFYNWGRDLDLSLTEEDILRYNAKYVFLGHDHEPHEPEIVGNSVVYRFGSVMRRELSAYTPHHYPSFMQIIINPDGSFSEPVLIPIPHTQFENAFRWEEKKVLKKCTRLVSDIKSFLQTVDMGTGSKRKSIGSILVENLKAPKDVVDYLQVVYRANHIQFK